MIATARWRSPISPRKPYRPRARPATPDEEPLAVYRAKREPGATPEPFGSAQPSGQPGGIFVVQKHAASRLHYDLRLEIDGVLRSWAVPRGPSLDPAEKRLAMAVEEHPLDYASFEGVIAPGNYGAGAMIVWDHGRWQPIHEPEYPEGLAEGKLLFELSGCKLKGRWALIKTRGKDRAANEWLLVKKADGHATGKVLPETSVLTGRTVEDVAAGRTPGDAVRAALVTAKVPRRAVAVADMPLMFAEPRETPPADPGWVWELKYDGYRLLCTRDAGQARLYYRRGSEVGARYPEIAAAVAALPHDGLVLDGELVIDDEHGRPSFHRLQQRTNLTRPMEIRLAAVRHPAHLVCFDLLGFEGFDLRGLPLTTRKSLLRQLLPECGVLRYAEHFEVPGEQILAAALELGLEGVIGKRADSTYEEGRRKTWIKLKKEHTGEFVVVGFSPAEGGRLGFGSLFLAHATPGSPRGFTSVGSVGSGFDDAELLDVRRRLEPLAVETRPFDGEPAAATRGAVWVRPELVVEVKFLEWSEDGNLRAPVFVRLRDDKSAAECVDGPVRPPPLVASAPKPRRPARPPTDVPLSNQDKVFWPEDEYTKGDLVAYYRAVWPWISRYLEDRPLVLTRFPDGIHGKSFFQQDAPGHIPAWMRTESMYSSETGKETRFIVANDPASLVYVANLGSIPLHVWSSRVPSIQAPDWTILDLDPKGAPFSQVVELARAIHDLCDELGLPSYCKTSGKSGLHVLVPLGAQVTFDQGRELALLLARVVCDARPELATLVRVIGKRGGRVYIDCYQNGHGKLLVAPLCVRPEPGAPVSTPLAWDEVNERLDPRRFTIRTVPERLAALAVDPWAGLLTDAPDLLAVLERLGDKLARGKSRS